MRGLDLGDECPECGALQRGPASEVMASPWSVIDRRLPIPAGEARRLNRMFLAAHPLRVLLALIVMVAVPVAASMVIGQVGFGGWLPPVLHVASVGAFTVAISAAAFVGVVLLIFARPLRRLYRLHGHDLCVGCGYWLGGFETSPHRCPECGRRNAGPCEPVPTLGWELRAKA